MKFDKKRTGTGTKEWAEVNENICIGCPNNCLYCYAAANAKRFKKRERDQWHIEEFTKRALMTSYPAKNGVIMFPSTHDITPFNVDQYTRVAKLILEKGNDLLIVSKPRLDCISKLITAVDGFQSKILFRFTIGTFSDQVSLFWEPGAPLPSERLECLIKAKEYGFMTSVSIEPMLEGVSGADAVVRHVKPYITDTVWIGKMNKIRLRVDVSDPVNSHHVEFVEFQQRDSEILRLYDTYKDDPVIRWKDSIQAVVNR